MKYILLLFAIFSFFPTIAQNGITFKVEELSKPENLLYLNAAGDVYKNLINEELDFSGNGDELPYDIICQSEMPDSLATFGYHSFFNGMYKAYADHRPFVLSPDMIWLLISQGFAQHVNANSESLRHYFVDFAGKMSLVVYATDVSLTSSADKWETVFPKFISVIDKNTKNNIIEILSADFSTTTPTERIASQITIMEAMKPYFEFVVIKGICGIPEITLTGTTEDWQKILDKAGLLAEYNLKWWTDELEPLLKEFVEASKGDIDTTFWRNMFKYHSANNYGAPKIIDGWIVKFFPYDNVGKRNNLISLRDDVKLPKEIVKVDLTYIEELNGGKTEITMLELWAGFIGLKQNEENYALTPQIGWMVRKKDIDDDALLQKFQWDIDNGGSIYIAVKEIPSVLLELNKIESLNIDFTDRIVIPDKLKDVNIGSLNLNGKISRREIERIKEMFPESGLTINNREVQESKWIKLRYDPISVEDNSYRLIADSILGTYLPADFAKSFNYVLTEKTALYDLNKGWQEIINVWYYCVNKYNQYYKYHGGISNHSWSWGFPIIFDMSGNLLTPESDMDNLKAIYRNYDVKLINSDETLLIVEEQTNNKNFYNTIPYYDSKLKAIVFKVYSNKWKKRKGDIENITINAETGSILDIEYCL